MRADQPSLLHAELRTLVERAAVGLLADEADPRRLQLVSDSLQALRSSDEIGLAQVCRARRRAGRCIRDADPVRQQLELLGRLEDSRRESRRMQQAPEVVARIGEVRLRGRRHTPGIDPAEQHP